MSITVNNLSHLYHQGSAMEMVALDNLNLSIENGQWVCIVGHTGSGKSTLAQHLNAILTPSSGTVTVDNMVIDSQGKGDYREIRRRVGLVFQYPEQQLFEETVADEIAFGPKNWGVDPSELPALVDQSMALVGLDESYRERNPFNLSGGEKRRVALASVLSSNPSYLVLDEPTAGLDGRGRRELLTALERIHSSGTTVVQITHDLDIAFSYADTILVLYRGQSRVCGCRETVAEELLRSPVPGLVLPDVLLLSLELRSRGRKVPVTSNEQELVDALRCCS